MVHRFYLCDQEVFPECSSFKISENADSMWWLNSGPTVVSVNILHG